MISGVQLRLNSRRRDMHLLVIDERDLIQWLTDCAEAARYPETTVELRQLRDDLRQSLDQ